MSYGTKPAANSKRVQKRLEELRRRDVARTLDDLAEDGKLPENVQKIFQKRPETKKAGVSEKKEDRDQE